MRRLIALFSAVLLTAAMSACVKNDPVAPTAAPTAAPTDAPYIDAQPDEPEWTLADGELKLEDSNNIYAEGDDILYFAIVENSGSRELRFRMDEETAAMLTQQKSDNDYYITFNGEKIGSATVSKDGTVATVTAEDANGEITALATKIRGLTE